MIALKIYIRVWYIGQRQAAVIVWSSFDSAILYHHIPFASLKRFIFISITTRNVPCDYHQHLHSYHHIYQTSHRDHQPSILTIPDARKKKHPLISCRPASCACVVSFTTISRHDTRHRSHTKKKKHIHRSHKRTCACTSNVHATIFAEKSHWRRGETTHTHKKTQQGCATTCENGHSLPLSLSAAAVESRITVRPDHII